MISYLRGVERFRAQDSLRSDLDGQLRIESLGRSALAEALNWADSIDQYLRAGPRSGERDPEWADRLPAADQELVQGFQRVRNVVHHRWWEAVAVRLQMRQGVQVNEWCWGDLPSGTRRGRGQNARGDAAYGARLRGRRVLDTLDELARIFWERRRWEITASDLAQPGHAVADTVDSRLEIGTHGMHALRAKSREAAAIGTVDTAFRAQFGPCRLWITTSM